MQIYSTRDGDVLDEIVWRHYGVTSTAMLRQVFAANPTLADRPAVMPAGVSIILPDIEQPAAETPGVSLWD